MYCVYILISKKNKSKFYIGYTDNLQRRLAEHKGPPKNSYTYRYAPWELETYIVFSNKKLAEEFELYLKSHSGRAFLRRRLAALR
ncbi:MAG: GIY-YIG nuclease family protein [Candidatus Omnitrophota bacterium]